MSSGAAALGGYIYQADYMAFRMLSSEATRGVREDVSECICSFAVEGRVTDEGQTWDICFKHETGAIHLRECKNTRITREDRRTFYRRVRRELATGMAPSLLTIGWVTDADKQGEILDHFRGASQLAADGTEIEWGTCPERVESAGDALSEALYSLCAAMADDAQISGVPVSAAKELISRLVVEEFRHQELVESVRLLATGVFESGTGEAMRKFIVGELATEVASRGSADYDRRSFLAAIQTGQIALAVEGTFREILCFASKSLLETNLPRITWDRLLSQPATIWPLDERLPGWDVDRSCVIVAQAGVGKTGTTWQAFEAQGRILDSHHVLRFDAATLEPGKLEALPRLCCMLCGVAPTWIAIDAIDEIEREQIGALCSVIDVLLRLPRLTLVLTTREEVLAAEGRLQQLVTGLPEVRLEPLAPRQVCDAFQGVGLCAPSSSSVIECLRNTFLLSLYAKLVTEDDMPLAESGEITGFQIIEEYWRRRVFASSCGLRGTSDLASDAQKRRAIAHLVDQTLDGNMKLSLRDVDTNIAAGVDALRREGVLLHHSTNAVRWAHEWLREYAIIDRIVEEIDQPSPSRLASALEAVTIDDVRRTASVAAAKYILAHPEHGRIEDFLNVLFEMRRELCSEALPVLVEGSANMLRLPELSVPLIIEAVEIAIQVSATQWVNAISGLPSGLFAGPDGDRLDQVVVRYETEVASNV